MTREERIKFWSEEVGPPPKINCEPNKCTKRDNGYHFYLRCTCGAEMNIDCGEWDWFKRCPNCGTTCEEVIE